MKSLMLLRPCALSAALACALLGAALLAPACSQETPKRAAPLASTEPPEADEFASEIERLEALGYVAASEPATDRVGVVRNDARAQPGFNFYLSGHAPQAILMDLAGKVVHRWQHDFRALLDSLGQESEGLQFLDERRYWRRAHLLRDGALLAIHTHHSLIKLSRSSKLLWSYPKRVHHDLDVDPEGRIYTLTNEERVIERVNPKRAVFEDFLVILSPMGRELDRVSLLEAVEKAGLDELLAAMPRQGDLFHTNTVEWLDGSLAEKIPAFARGNVLLSFLMLNTLAVLDPGRREIVWWQQGPYRLQHDPSVLADGSLLLFDNFGPALNETERDLRPGHYQRVWYRNIFSQELPSEPASALLEIDPRSGEVLWSYRAPAGERFSSETCGAAQRLENGNTLAVETQYGRAFEVTRSGEIVWEFVSPHRIGPNVTRLFDLQRVSSASVDWLPEMPEP